MEIDIQKTHSLALETERHCHVNGDSTLPDTTLARDDNYLFADLIKTPI